jgi:hypothetical protein
MDGGIELMNQPDIIVLVELHNGVEPKLSTHSIGFFKVPRSGHLPGVNGMLRGYPLLEWHIHLIENLLLSLVVKPLIPNPIVPRGEVRVHVTELLVLKI